MSRRPHLNRQLVLEAQTRVPDAAGGYILDWATLGTLWAEIRPGSGRERSDSATAMSRVPLRIIVRGAPVGSTARPAAGQRFREGTRIFHITAVTEYDLNAQYLTCFAEEEVSS